MTGQFQFPVELINHIRDGRNDEAKAMLNDDLVKTDTDRGTLLHYATANNNVAMIHHLIGMGCNIDSTSDEDITALTTAVIMSLVEPAKVLLQAGADVNIGHVANQSILQVVFHGQVSKCDLIEAFIDEIIRTRTNEPEEMVDELIALESTLYHAACTRDIKVMEIMMMRGFHVNSTGDLQRTALHAAAELDDMNLTKWLIGKGADVNAFDMPGYTPLTVAANCGSIKMIKLLLNEGADPNAQCPDTGMTPLHATFSFEKAIATEEQYDQCAEYLLRNGAIPKNPALIHLPGLRQTMLDFAFHRENYERIILLISYVTMLKMLGAPIIVESVMHCTQERHYPSQMKACTKYYKMCQQILTVTMFENLSLLDLLKNCGASKMKPLVRNKTFIRKVEEACSEHELSEFYPYYYNILVKGISEAKNIVELEEAAILVICKISKYDVSQYYHIARQVIGYLNMHELEELRWVYE